MREPNRNKLTRNSSGDTRPQSSQPAEPLWTDPGVKCEISVCELISTHTHTHTHTKQNRIRGKNSRTFFQYSGKRGKPTHVTLCRLGLFPARGSLESFLGSTVLMSALLIFFFSLLGHWLCENTLFCVEIVKQQLQIKFLFIHTTVSLPKSVNWFGLI